MTNILDEALLLLSKLSLTDTSALVIVNLRNTI
jgi:hypothetical protein